MPPAQPPHPGKSRAADETYQVHAALVKAEADDPALKNNPRWRLLRMDAYEDFRREYGEKP